jgi:hypothetical protein
MAELLLSNTLLSDLARAAERAQKLAFVATERATRAATLLEVMTLIRDAPLATPQKPTYKFYGVGLSFAEHARDDLFERVTKLLNEV